MRLLRLSKASRSPATLSQLPDCHAHRSTLFAAALSGFNPRKETILMSNSKAYNDHYADLELIEYTMPEMIDRYANGDFLTYRQRKDVERVLEHRRAAAKTEAPTRAAVVVSTAPGRHQTFKETEKARDRRAAGRRARQHKHCMLEA